MTIVFFGNNTGIKLSLLKLAHVTFCYVQAIVHSYEVVYGMSRQMAEEVYTVDNEPSF